MSSPIPLILWLGKPRPRGESPVTREKPKENRKSFTTDEVCLILLKSILPGTRIWRPDSGPLSWLLLMHAVGPYPVPSFLLLVEKLTAVPFDRTTLQKLNCVCPEGRRNLQVMRSAAGGGHHELGKFPKPALWQDSSGFERPPSLVPWFSRFSAGTHPSGFWIKRSGLGPWNLHDGAPRESSSVGSQTALWGALLQSRLHGLESPTKLGWNPGSPW